MDRLRNFLDPESSSGDRPPIRARAEVVDEYDDEDYDEYDDDAELYDEPLPRSRTRRTVAGRPSGVRGMLYDPDPPVRVRTGLTRGQSLVGCWLPFVGIVGFVVLLLIIAVISSI